MIGVSQLHVDQGTGNGHETKMTEAFEGRKWDRMLGVEEDGVAGTDVP